MKLEDIKVGMEVKKPTRKTAFSNIVNHASFLSDSKHYNKFTVERIYKDKFIVVRGTSSNTSDSESYTFNPEDLDPIEEPIVHKYKVGDKVKIVGRNHSHGFAIGETVEITELGIKNSKSLITYRAKNKNHIYYCHESDFAPIPEPLKPGDRIKRPKTKKGDPNWESDFYDIYNGSYYYTGINEEGKHMVWINPTEKTGNYFHLNELEKYDETDLSTNKQTTMKPFYVQSSINGIVSSFSKYVIETLKLKFPNTMNDFRGEYQACFTKVNTHTDECNSFNLPEQWNEAVEYAKKFAEYCTPKKPTVIAVRTSAGSVDVNKTYASFKGEDVPVANLNQLKDIFTNWSRAKYGTKHLYITRFKIGCTEFDIEDLDRLLKQHKENFE